MIAMQVDPHSGAGAPGSACQERGLAEYTPRNNRDVYKKAVTGTLCINEDLHSVPETPVWDTSPLFMRRVEPSPDKFVPGSLKYPQRQSHKWNIRA
jgi:hypothetical protein